jgi:hypothetical protein
LHSVNPLLQLALLVVGPLRFQPDSLIPLAMPFPFHLQLLQPLLHRPLIVVRFEFVGNVVELVAEAREAFLDVAKG